MNGRRYDLIIIDDIRHEPMKSTIVTVEGTPNAIEHLSEVLRTLRLGVTRNHNPNRFSPSGQNRKRAADPLGFYNFTFDERDAWAATVLREAVRWTSRVEFSERAITEATFFAGLDDRSVVKTPGRTIETEHRRDQPIAAARVLGHLLGNAERRAAIESIVRLEGNLDAIITDAMHAEGMSDLLIKPCRFDPGFQR